MALTQADIQQVLNAIKADSQGIEDLPVVTSLLDVKSLPATKGSEVVSVPISLLGTVAETAATEANKAKDAANRAASGANTAKDEADKAAALATSTSAAAHSAAQLANESAALAAQKATEADNAKDRAIETAEHPTYIGDDQYVYMWDAVNDVYSKTDIYVKGDSGVYVGAEPTLYDQVWIDPNGSAATADDILTRTGETVQENLDELNQLRGAMLTLTLTQSSATNLAYAFTKANFDAVALAAQQGVPSTVKVVDKRGAAYKTIDLGAIYPAKWNTTLSQIEIPEPSIARGLYLNGSSTTSRGCTTSNTPRYVALGFRFTPLSGHYTYNQINNLTEMDVELIVSFGHIELTNMYEYKYGTYQNPIYAGLRTILNAKSAVIAGPTSAAPLVNFHGAFRLSEAIEVLDVTSALQPSVTATDLNLAFYGCNALRTIIGEIICQSAAIGLDNLFWRCRELQDVKLTSLYKSVSFQYSPKLTQESIMWIVNNSANGATPITITLHATALARLTPEDIALASSRNITLTA